MAGVSTYLLVDGNSLTYRAFFALPADMATASGQVTNAVFGFTSMLINVIKDQECDGMVVAFDRPEPTFRHEAEPQYKAQREAAPDILRQQMGLVREVLDAVGIQQIEAAGWEADDLIATLSTKLVAVYSWRTSYFQQSAATSCCWCSPCKTRMPLSTQVGPTTMCVSDC